MISQDRKNKNSKIRKLFSKIFFFKKSANQIDRNGKKQIELDKKLVFSLSKSRIPSIRQLKYLNRYLNSTERWLVRSSLAVIIISVFVFGIHFYVTHLKEVPIAGGVYTEGLVGVPKYINPLYANISDVDNDIQSLVFSSLFKRGKNGELEPDLVEHYEISDDSKIYTFQIRNNVLWHDGSNLNTNDIVFTFNAIRDVNYKSPLRPSFEGVEIEKIDDYSFKFILLDPYAAFLELLTFGIMPAAVWSQVSPESAAFAGLNLKPIGSGPYKFKEYKKDEKTGVIKSYSLEVNEDYYGRHPLISVHLEFFPDFAAAINALNDKQIDGISYLPPELKKNIIKPKSLSFHSLSLPQLTLLFFNTKDNKALGDKIVRQALAYGVDRQSIVDNILGQNAQVVNGPILPNSFAYFEKIKNYEFNQEKARKLLDEAGWKEVNISQEDFSQAQEKFDQEENVSSTSTLAPGPGKWRQKDDNYLTIRLATVDRNENRQVVEEIARLWQEIGVKSNIEIYSVGQIQSNVIRLRDFDVLFYGQVIGADPDPYAFWHSSQTGESGFNIAGFANKEVDELLEEARLVSDLDSRKEKYIKFQEIINDEVPAIFMYSPVYTYIQSKKLQGFNVLSILYPADRFTNIEEWYIETGKKLQW